MNIVFLVLTACPSQRLGIVDNSGGPLDNQTWHLYWPQKKPPKFGFRAQTTALWPMEQSCILFAKFDCRVHMIVKLPYKKSARSAALARLIAFCRPSVLL